MGWGGIASPEYLSEIYTYMKYGFVNSVKNCLSNILIVFKPNSPVWGKKGNKAKGEGSVGWMKMVATEQHIIKINEKSEEINESQSP